MERRIYNPRYCYEHAWEQGDILIADNHALIHGRHALTRDCPRHLRRIQLI
jgi:L-tyrosine isonitrile desaturase/decarboxylase